MGSSCSSFHQQDQLPPLSSSASLCSEFGHHGSYRRDDNDATDHEEQSGRAFECSQAAVTSYLELRISSNSVSLNAARRSVSTENKTTMMLSEKEHLRDDTSASQQPQSSSNSTSLFSNSGHQRNILVETPLAISSSSEVHLHHSHQQQNTQQQEIPMQDCLVSSKQESVTVPLEMLPPSRSL